MLLGLAACGGGDSNSSVGQVRVINTTQNHAGLDLLSSSTPVIQNTAKDTASNYAGVGAGSPTLQVNDAGTATALTTITPTVSGSLHYVVIVYESNGTVKAAVLGEDNALPTTGSAQLRIFDAAPEAGALDVYVTAPGAALGTPSFTIPASASASTSALLTFSAGTFEVRVTGQGNQNDLRLDIPSVTLASQQITTVLLTASKGGVLVDGGALVQQGSYTPARNTNARVRLANGVLGGTSVAANAGATSISAPLAAPAVGSYAVVPTASAITISVAGGAAIPVTGTLTAGSDATLLVTGTAGAPTATLINDDNHLPVTNQIYKMRLVNGLSNTATAQTLTADFAVVASNVTPNSASNYGSGQGSASSQLDVEPLGTTLTSLSLVNNAVYSVFVFGDPAVPSNNVSGPKILLRRDR